jgi:hypothetical protein
VKKYLDWFPARFRELSHPAKLSLLVSALLVWAFLMILTASHSKENPLSTSNAQQVVSPTYYCGGSCPTGSPTPTYSGGGTPSPSASISAVPSVSLNPTTTAAPSGQPPVSPTPGTPLDQLIQLIQQLIQQLQQLIQKLLGGGGVVVDYSGVPLSVTANWSGTNVNSVQSGRSVSLANFTIAGSHPNQVVYLTLVSKGATDLGNVRCLRAGAQFVLLQKSDWNSDTVYIFYRGHGNLSVFPGSDPIDCSWDNSATVNLGAVAVYNVDNSAAEFYSKAVSAGSSSFPSVVPSSTPGNLIFGWGAVGVDIPVAPANYISAYLLNGAQSVDLTSFVVGPGANEAMFVGITSPGPLDATVTWDGHALSLIDAYPVPNGFVGCSNNNTCETQGYLYWYLLAAPNPGNRVLNVSWTNRTSDYGDPIVDIGAISFSGVNQKTPYSSITHSSGLDDGVDSPVNSITIPTAAGDETVALWGSINMEGCKWNQTPNWPTDGHGINSLSSRAAGTSTSNTHSLIHAGSACGIRVPSGGYWGMSGFNIKAQ